MPYEVNIGNVWLDVPALCWNGVRRRQQRTQQRMREIEEELLRSEGKVKYALLRIVAVALLEAPCH